MRKIILLAFVATFGLLVTSCGGCSTKNGVTTEPNVKVTVHSELLAADVDVSQANVMSFKAVEGEGKAIAIFNEDASLCELIVGDEHHILERRTALSGPVWNVEDDDTYNVRALEHGYDIMRRGTTVYIKE